MEKFTVLVGCTGAHSHYGLLGQGLASWPKLAAFGSHANWSMPRARPEHSYVPLHRNLYRDGRKGVLTEAARGSAVALDVDADKWIRSGRRPPAQLLSCSSTP
jgi:hypothetical protein